MNQSLSALERQGYVHIPLPQNLRSNIALVEREWVHFCGNPETVKLAFSYENGVGYEQKLETHTNIDYKENFHYTVDAHTILFSRAKGLQAEVRDRDRLPMFLNCSKLLMLALRPVVQEVSESIEREFGLTGLSEEVRAGEGGWFLRYLHYFGDRNVGEEIAAPHADKSGFTLHLYENESGLEHLPYETPQQGVVKWRSMPLAQKTTVVIPGMQLQHKTAGRVKALCHRVVANTRTAQYGRYSIVCFVPFPHSPKYNKGAAGRLQEFPPGFNYSMPSDEFAKLFV